MTNLKQLKKLIKTDISDGHGFLSTLKPEFIDYLCHLTHTFKKYANKGLKPHIKKVLKSKDRREAKKNMKLAHLETGGSFFGFLKNAGASVVDLAKRAGNSIADTTSSYFDKAKTLAQKGLLEAKPYIKEYAPLVLSKASSMIPVVGNIAEPIVKKGAEWLLNKWK